jgi:hypothetical protein
VAKVYIVSFRSHDDRRPSKFIVLADGMKSAISKAWEHGGADFQSRFDKSTGQAQEMKEGALRAPYSSLPPYMQDSVLERWLAFLHTGLSPVEPSELILAHSCFFSCLVPHAFCLFSFDQPIRSGEHLRWNCQPDLLGGFEIDHKLKLGWQLDWQISGFGSLQDSVLLDHCSLLRAASPRS